MPGICHFFFMFSVNKYSWIKNGVFKREKLSADIGQFFRYDKHFNNNLIRIFQEEYNQSSDYKLNKDLKIYGILDNLLNSKIYIWDKYKEREIYIAAGILWQF